MELAVLDTETKVKEKFLEDPLISMVVPIYDIKPEVLKRCLMSLNDQNYENMEIICVLDGPDPELKRVCENFNFDILEIEHGGACAARNAGFKISQGEVVSFFNSDYVAKPGMVRMWVDALQANPDCGFVYGGYEYNSNRRYMFDSGKFDPYILNVENYIDCGFPLWRKYVVDWDVNCKSLQDWDFWLRVVKTHNIKGHYLGRDYSFIAEVPRPKGLSEDSSQNWNDRVNYIKTKNGIEKRDILVTSLGAPNHAIEIAKLIGADYRTHTWHKTEWIEEYKALYMIGMYMKPNESGLNEHARRLAIFKDKNPKAKRIVHYVGADIYWLRKFPYESLKYLAGALNMSTDHILCENQDAQDELKEYGIKAEIVPIPSYTPNWEVKPLPEEFSVACYMVEAGVGSGQSDFDKYCYEASLSIIRAMPDVKFVGYGTGGDNIEYPNYRHAGIIPRDKWPEFVYSQSALIRLCRHDHNPMASNEFIMAGRDVITNINTLGARIIDTSGKMELNEWDKFSEGFNTNNWPETKAKIIREIRKVKKQNGSGSFGFNALPSFELKRILDQQTYINKIRELCDAKN